MRFSVTDVGARLFTEILYKKLAYGETLTRAVHDARLALWEHVQERRQHAPTVFTPAEWFTPVLYQNQAIGALVKKGQYHTETLNRFYPKPAFLRGSHTRLIGEGFIGRKRLLIRLRKSFKEGKHVCLHGLGGLGKTTTAEAFAEQYRRRNGHDILIFRKDVEIQEAVILEKIYKRWKSRTKPEDWVADDLKESLDNPKLEIDQKLQLLIDNCLNGHPTILIFDNFEDVQTDQDDVQQQIIVSESLRAFLRYLLQNVPSACHLLFTTRYAIADLADLVTDLAIDKMSYAEQYRYLNFSETLRRLPMKEREIIDRRMDGHPRALEFLEGLLKKDRTFELTDLDAQIKKVEDKISENLLLKRIVSRLSDAERDVFAVASIFFSRTPLAALGAVIGKEIEELIPVLTSLHDWSLCFWDETARTFEVHALTRLWMWNQRKPEQEWFRELSKQAGDYFREQPTWEDEFLAKAYFEQAEAWEDYTNSVFTLEGHFRLIGFYSNAWDLSQEVLKKNISLQLNSDCLNRLGTVCHLVGDYGQALGFWESSLTIRRQIGDKPGEGRILNNLSQIYDAQGDYTRALSYLEQSLSIRRQIGDNRGEAITLSNLAAIAYSHGDYTRALDYFEQSLSIQRQIGDTRGEGITLNNISQIYDAQGDYPRALSYLEQSLSIAREIGDKSGEGTTLNNIGQIYAAQGDYPRALSYLEQSLSIQRQIGDKSGEGTTLNNISQIYKARGDYGRALEYLEQSLRIRLQIGDKSGEGTTLYNMGVLYFKQFQDVERAVPMLLRAYYIFEQIGSPNIKSVESWIDGIYSKIGEERFNQILQAIQNNPPA